MSHNPIFLNNLSVVYPSKICFEDFSATIYAGDRIALMGRNGSGKTSLLKILADRPDISSAFVPQLIDGNELSGGQRFNTALSEALSKQPDLLLLDEPTNHLDRNNHQSLMRMLQHFGGTIVVASHDVELLRSSVDIFWHFDQGKIHIFKGRYDDYKKEILYKRQSIEEELNRLDRQKKETHRALMKEQERASKSKILGQKNRENKKWEKMAAGEKAQKGQETFGRKKTAIDKRKDLLLGQMAAFQLPEIVLPTFSLSSADVGYRTVVEINHGACGYNKSSILKDISFIMQSSERIAVVGNNGSGKTTFIKALRGDPEVWRAGNWFAPQPEEIGYLDQHYADLAGETVLDCLSECVPTWSHAGVRKHLNDFLFRENEEVNAKISTLSGGEKARLSLALIAAKTPRLLILDEVTNNLDLETKDHVLQVLKNYPGALLIVSHDQNFLDELNCDVYNIGEVSQIQEL